MNSVSFESAGWCEFASFVACAVVDESPTCFPSALCRTAAVAFGSWSKVGAKSAKQTQGSQMRDETSRKLHCQRGRQVSWIGPTCRTNSIANLKSSGKNANNLPKKQNARACTRKDYRLLILISCPFSSSLLLTARLCYSCVWLCFWYCGWLLKHVQTDVQLQKEATIEVTWQCEPETALQWTSSLSTSDKACFAAFCSCHQWGKANGLIIT